jgi:nitrogen fixation/metabolism regulation signal transduction histidine kinase
LAYEIETSATRTKTPPKKLSYEHRLVLMTLGAALPAMIVALVLLWTGDYSARVQWTLTVVILGLWLGFALALRERIVMPLQTLSNLLGALREEDFSLRARGADPGDAMGEVLREANALSETLREQRLGAEEASALLRTVMDEIDVAIFAFDGGQRLRLVNKAGEHLLGQPAERIAGQNAGSLGLAECLTGEPQRTLERSFPGKPGQTARWGLRRSTFREGGLPHHLIVLADLSRPLREEERQAWQRLIRVLGHELNNSLAPIKSMAGTLESLLVREPSSPDWKQDMRRGLEIISSRSESLSRFMNAYSQLARLPQPRLGRVQVGELIRRVAELETRLSALLVPGPSSSVVADADQLEQLLINLVRNATDAALETGGGVRVGWVSNAHFLDIWIEDEGPGLPSSANLFVPFFTTKPSGSGIGLVLSRQIAEAHGGTLSLENRQPGPGCVARLRLPVSGPVSDGY